MGFILTNRKVYILYNVPNYMYIRKKLIKGKEYYYLVKGIKGKKNTQQKVICYVGDKEALKKLADNIKKKL